MFTLLGALMSIMDALAVNSMHLLNLVNVPIVLYQVVKIMDTKQPRLANSLFPLITFVLTIFQIYIYLAANIVASKDTVVELPKFPLYEPAPELTGEALEGQLTDQIEPNLDEDELSWFGAVKARLSLSGFWFFLEWIIYPFFSWIVKPWWDWTIAPILYPICDSLISLLTVFTFWAPPAE